MRAFLTSSSSCSRPASSCAWSTAPLWATIPAAWRLQPRTILGAGYIVAIAVVALALALIRLAFSNHRTADRGTTRVATQAACIAAGLVAIVAVSIVAGL